MTRKIIIAYNLKGIKSPLKITRNIYGYTEHSNNNQYKYERKGILSDIKYDKLSRACFMIDKRDAKSVIKAMKELDIIITILDVELKKRQNLSKKVYETRKSQENFIVEIEL